MRLFLTLLYILRIELRLFAGKLPTKEVHGEVLPDIRRDTEDCYWGGSFLGTGIGTVRYQGLRLGDAGQDLDATAHDRSTGAEILGWSVEVLGSSFGVTLNLASLLLLVFIATMGALWYHGRLGF